MSSLDLPRSYGKANDGVEEHLAIVRDCIIGSGLKPIALVLGGSFGRGEGGIRRDGAGNRLPVNDYDVYIVTEGDLSPVARFKLRHLGRALASKLGIWHVDLIPVNRHDLIGGRVRMAFYDLKCGSRVFFGDPSVISEIPYEANGRIPSEEVRDLLINRMVTLMEGHPTVSPNLPSDQKARQIAKVYFAITDSRLVEHGVYETLYREKTKRLREMSRIDAVGSVIASKIDWCWRSWHCDMEANELCDHQLLSEWNQARSLLIGELVRISELLDSCSYRQDFEELISNWRGSPPASRRERVRQAVLLALQRKRSRRSIEVRMFALLKVYPEEKVFENLRLRVPRGPSSKNGAIVAGTTWSSCAQDLVEGWYGS